MMAKTTSKNPKGAGRPSLPEKKSKTSLYMDSDIVRSIKYIAFMDEQSQTDIVAIALNKFISDWESKNHPIPKK